MRLIDADKVLVFKMYYDDETEEFYEKEYTIEDFIDTFSVDGCPKAVDAEPVVRCKDCKYWCPNQKFQNDSVYYCSKLGVDMKAIDFCSRGEQKDE